MKEVYKKKNPEKVKAFKNDIRLFAKENELVIQETDETDSIKWICQLKKESKLTLGIASKALTIVIDEFSDDTIKISVGEGKWLPKIAGSAVTMVTSGPLFLLAGATTANGIFKQIKLAKQVQNFIEINFD